MLWVRFTLAYVHVLLALPIEKELSISVGFGLKLDPMCK